MARSAKNREDGLARWWAAKHCGRKGAGRAASFALLLVLTLQPLAAAGQTRCETAAARIVSAEGEVSIIGPVGAAVQAVWAGEVSDVCSGQTVLVGPRSRLRSPRRHRTGDTPRSGYDTAGSAAPPARAATARSFARVHRPV